MGLAGSVVKNTNVRLRFFSIILVGVIAFGAVMYWREKTLVAEEYVEFPVHAKAKRGTPDLKSKNYQLEVQDSSPSVK